MRGSLVGCPFFFYRFWIVFLSHFFFQSSSFAFTISSFSYVFDKKATLGARQDAPVKKACRLGIVSRPSMAVVSDLDVVLWWLCLFVLLLLLKFLFFFFSAFTDNGDSDGEKW